LIVWEFPFAAFKVFVKGLRPFGHETCRRAHVESLKAEWLRSPGPDPVYKLICLIQDLDFTYMLT